MNFLLEKIIFFWFIILHFVSMAFYDPIMVEVKVLLVDRDANSLLMISNLLQINSYKVTAVQEASIAASMLNPAGTTKFELVMIDVSSSGVEAYKLLHAAVHMGSTVILMSDNSSPALARCAIEDGAFLFLQKPATMDVLKYLWQHVLREKMRIVREKGSFSGGYQLMGENSGENLTANFIDTIEYGPINNEASQEGIGMEESNNNNSNSPGNAAKRTSRKPKICTEWTPELHDRFMYAVRYLGEGRCFPKEILDVMNVPGLTRMQVASHLQKCRTGCWQLPEERKPRCRRSRSPSSSGSSSRPKRYGIFPRQIRGRLHPSLSTERENPNDQQLQVPFGQQQHGTFDSPVSDNSINNENFNENVNDQNVNAASPNHGLQILEMISFDFDADNDDQAVTGINFNLQDVDWDKVDPAQVANMANADAEGFWSAWISGFAKDK